MSEMTLMAHVLLGVSGTLLAVGVFFDTLNLSEANKNRIYALSLAVAAFIAFSYLIGGYWYVTSYAADKAIINAGPWPWAHKFFMEAKEHVFFILLLLSLYLPFVTARMRLPGGENFRKLTLVIAALIVALGLTMDGMGAIIAMGVRVGLGGGA